MDKANVIKALEICEKGEGDCTGCPYSNIAGCTYCLNKDAISLLKANEKPTYHQAIIFTKRDNLSKWFDANCSKFIVDGNMEYSEHFVRAEKLYAQERDIQLILLVRYENGKCICRIKCPINPLPIKGEFQCVSTSEMSKLLTSMGWTYKEKYGIEMFR